MLNPELAMPLEPDQTGLTLIGAEITETPEEETVGAIATTSGEVAVNALDSGIRLREIVLSSLIESIDSGAMTTATAEREFEKWFPGESKRRGGLFRRSI